MTQSPLRDTDDVDALVQVGEQIFTWMTDVHAVIANPRTPDSVLWKIGLSEDLADHVRWGVLEHPNASTELLEAMIFDTEDTDAQYRILQCLLQRPQLTSEALISFYRRTLYSGRSYDAVRTWIRHPSTPVESLVDLLGAMDRFPHPPPKYLRDDVVRIVEQRGVLSLLQ